MSKKARITQESPFSWIIDWVEDDEAWLVVLGILCLLVFGILFLIWWLWQTKIGRFFLILTVISVLALSIYLAIEQEEVQEQQQIEQDQQYHRLSYTLLNDGTYEVNGSGIYSDDENIVIASEYDGIPVTRIGDGAFKNRRITSITIPNSVTSIGNEAFYGCTRLTSVTIPDSVTSIGNGAFCDCSSLTSIVIPNSVITIGGSAFMGCKSLTSTTLPVGITVISERMFYSCQSLKSITIPDGVTRIEKGAFGFCYSLASITIPTSVSYIGELALAYDKSLTTINYLGTWSQWGVTEKFTGWSTIDGILNWDASTDNYVVYFIDGGYQAKN